MEPSEQQSSRHRRGASERVLVPDGGSRDTDEEYWKWDPSVDEEPVIEPDESGEETHADRSSDGTPSGRDSPAGGQGPQPGSGAPPTRGPDADQPHATPGESSPEQPLPSASSPDELDERQSADGGAADDSGISRRALLFGGAGAAATAAVAGGWYIRSQGRSGAEALVEAYITAIAADDWEGAGELYHEQSRPMQRIRDDSSVDDYEGLLESTERLELYEALSPSVDTIQVLEHVPEVTDDISRERFFVPDEVEQFTAWKQIAATVTIDTETLSLARRGGGYADQLAGSQTKELMVFDTVRTDREWFLLSTNSRL